MADTNKGGGKMKSPLGGRKIKFNLYWIYALVLIVLMFVWFGGSGESTVSKDIKWDRLKKVLVNKDYSKINVVNKEFAEDYIKNESIANNDEYKDLRNNGGLFGSSGETNSGFYACKFVNYDDLREPLPTACPEFWMLT